MATVRSPNSVAARKTRIAISLRLATNNFLAARDGKVVAPHGDSTVILRIQR
jgi:hypothetical protein